MLKYNKEITEGGIQSNDHFSSKFTNCINFNMEDGCISLQFFSILHNSNIFYISICIL